MGRPVLIGYMALESWADDYSEWDGAIVGPENPKGANAFWINPIPMIEKREYDKVLAALINLCEVCSHAANLGYFGKGSTEGWVRDEMAKAMRVMRSTPKTTKVSRSVPQEPK